MTFLDLMHLFFMPLAIGLGVAAIYVVIGIMGQNGDLVETAHGFVPRKSNEPSNPYAPAESKNPQPPAMVVTPVYFSDSANHDAQYTDILVVDDSSVARAKLAKLFETAGYTVHLANDGVQALDILAEGHFHLLITDLEMPNMNGFELIAAVQGSMATEDLPIIAITGHEEMQARVHDCQGLYGIFKKPWNDRDLLKRVATLVHMQRQKVQAGIAP